MVALTYHAATHRDLELLIFLPDSTSCMLGLQICAFTLNLESSCFFFFPQMSFQFRPWGNSSRLPCCFKAVDFQGECLRTTIGPLCLPRDASTVTMHKQNIKNLSKSSISPSREL